MSSLNRTELENLLSKTAYAAPMADPTAAAGAAPPMDPAAMGGAPPMDPAMAGAMPPAAPPMDPAMAGAMPPVDPAMAEQMMAAAGGAPPMDPAMAGAPGPGPGEAAVGAVAAEQGPGEPPPEPTVADLTIPDLQALIADSVAAALEGAQDNEVPGQLSDMQDEIAGMKETGGAIPIDAPSMPAPEEPSLGLPIEEGFSEEVPDALPKVASEQQGELLIALKRLNNLR